MLGTPTDGIKAPLAEIGAGGAPPRLRLLQFLALAFPEMLRERISRAANDLHRGGGEFSN